MSILGEIIDYKKTEVEASQLAISEDSLRARIKASADRRRFFKKTGKLQLIAEIKAKSPSRGLIRDDFDPAGLTKEFTKKGAAAISVLTDKKYFGGSLEILKSAREQTNLPLLRKDFIIDKYQVYESKASGADMVLLMAGVLKERLQEFVKLALAISLQPVIEIHEEAELQLARQSAGLNNDIIIGVNNRDLKTFEVSFDTCLRLSLRIPSNFIKLAESGVFTVDQLEQLNTVGFDAVLVGEGLAKNPGLFKYFSNRPIA